MSSLPPQFASALEWWLAEHAVDDLRGQVTKLSGNYRAGGSSARVDLGAYVAARVPATYAAVSRSMTEAARGIPDYAPRSILDLGAGAGSATWAAISQWPSIETVIMLDNDPRFLRLAEDIGERALPANVRINHMLGDISATLPQADLVLASYVVAERPLSEAGALAARLWAATGSMLLIVEPGTRAGFERIRAMRSILVKAGANILAPCTHISACPISGADWCHFTARVQRSRLHRHAKSADVPWEDEPFSYLAAVRSDVTPPAGRIMRPPRINKAEARFQLCTHAGMRELVVPKRDKSMFNQVRKLDWGDAFPEQDP
jgi:ribosomal protein RSM22 (predicted rRNA methylase)